MTVADVIRMLLEMDQQVCSPRPSHLGRAAILVAGLASHAESSIRDADIMGDWDQIDLSAVERPTACDPWQPTMQLAEENDQLRQEIFRLRRRTDRGRRDSTEGRRDEG